VRGRLLSLRSAPYWNIYPARHAAIWGALESVDAGNGTMSVLPGYHTRGCIPRLRGSDPSRGFRDPEHNIDPR
jgi:ectoine hydroxylase-related dioxygenase (phytanoyl-CoA dioxygenase family)